MTELNLFQPSDSEDRLVDSRADRDRFGDRTDVLDKVKALRLLPDGVHVTTELVANYYEVGVKAIASLVFDNRAEMQDNGYRIIEGEELNSFKESSHVGARAPRLAVFNRRAVMRIGFLLRDSGIARQVRDAAQDALDAAPVVDISDPLVALQRTAEQLSQAVILAFAERARADAAETKVIEQAPLVEQALIHNRADSVTAISAFATDVQVWGKERGITILQRQVFDFMGHLDLIIRGNRIDRNRATKHGLENDYVRNKTATYEHSDGEVGASKYARITPKGEQYVWKKVYAHVGQYGTLSIPRAGDAA